MRHAMSGKLTHQLGKQLSLAGFESPEPSDRLFFAVLPDAPTRARLAALAHALRDTLALQGRPRPTANLHVTLHFLGDHAGLPASLVDAARAAADAVALAPFQARFDRVASFGRHRREHPLVLLGDAPEADGWAHLHGRLSAALAAKGLLRSEPSFTPHVTLLYDTRQVTPQAIAPLGWTVREFLLIHSVLGHGEYRLLGRWPLRA